MAGTEIVWNSVSSTTMPGVVFTNPVRELLGKHRGTFQEVPGRRGSWYFPEVRGRRTISVSGFVEASGFPAQRRDAVTELANWLDVDIEARLILGDDPGVYYEAVLGDCGDINEWREIGQFEVEWHVSPFAYALSGTIITFETSNVLNTAFDPDLPTSVPCVVEIRPNNGYLTGFTFGMNGDLMTWGGTAGARPGAPLIQEDEVPLTSPDGGTLVDFIGQSSGFGYTPGYAIYSDGWIYDGLGWRLNRVNSGSTLTINGYSTVVLEGVNTDTELTGSYNPDLLAMTDVRGSFSSLIPGVNTLAWQKLTGTATAFTIKITYRKAFRR